jgi:glutamate-1-semialdehyde 2,1-aminomutase
MVGGPRGSASMGPPAIRRRVPSDPRVTALPRSPRFPRSDALLAEAATVLANWMPPLLDDAPRFTRRAWGCRLEDVDGNVFIDYFNAAGAVILGHADPVVRSAIVSQLDLVPTSTIDHPLRIEVARALLPFFPKAERVAFFKTGSEATQAAVRLARRFTRRSVVLRHGFHGWYDWCSRNPGVPAEVQALTVEVPYNDLGAVEAQLTAQPVAALILQPGGDYKLPEPGYLKSLVDLCHAHGALVIFDEIRTGLRFVGGAQGLFGVYPDLTTVSKGLANGLPLSAVVGRADVLALVKKSQVGGTYQRDVLAHAAAKATLAALVERGTVGHLHAMGTRLMEGMRQVAAAHPALGMSVHGLPPMPRILFTPTEGSSRAMRDRFHAGLFARGVLFPPHHHLFISGAHGVAEIDETIEALAASAAAAAELG